MALFISSNASADFSYRDLGAEVHVDNIRITSATTTNCIDGYKWVLVIHNKKQLDVPITIALEQFYIEKNGRAVPAKC
tara:strand:- start:120 stop:353 length:234 start_codon:yes stop_codon:yes gene_type:complete